MKNLTATSSASSFIAGQIVRGARAGTFVVLGFRSIGGEEHAQVAEVNPANHAQRGTGSFALPVTALLAV